ncbi:Isochorismatase-like protein [Boletus reticuloceps]|uniref:Isochorismatase-like protein n=1 Tax=Boletus reticuloceps TaxID=495285 RepID=A0A8I3A7A6_9AGAM|nr:Isochorismatase-like protein [Boletus reticuloceps]
MFPSQPQSYQGLTCRILLLIDVQVNLLRDPEQGGVPSAHTVRQNIQSILTQARSEKHPPRIIHVRNNGEPNDPDESNTPGWQLYFAPLPHEPVVDKKKNNAFAGTQLGDLIPKSAEVIVIGMQSDYCVRATCSAALGRGNEVFLIKGAHATLDRNEIWNDGTVTEAHVIEAEIEAELEEAGVIILDMKDLPDLYTR